jgi:hypothetical protein
MTRGCRQIWRHKAFWDNSFCHLRMKKGLRDGSVQSPTASMALPRGKDWRTAGPVRFPNWKEALERVVTHTEREAYPRSIVGFLSHCKKVRCPATLMLAKVYIEAREKQENCRLDTLRAALRWFFSAAPAQDESCAPGATLTVQSRSHELKVAPGTTRSDDAFHTGTAIRLGEITRKTEDKPQRRASIASRASDDQGGADWERDLIAALRRRGMLWRTEQTYRMWATRFTAQLADKSPYAAGCDDVAGFLSRLAIEQRASPATQKQALNALVFFLQEGLKRDLGQFDFKRARTRQSVPTVLTPDECRRLFE